MNDRPNLVLITTDQQRHDTIGVTGNPAIMTPHLNWMADTGVLFRRAYSDAPVCVAARATLLTGKTFLHMEKGFGDFGQTTTRHPDQTLPAILTRNGYQTKSVGKLHSTPPRCNYGFEHIEILEDYYRFVRQFPERGVPMDHGVGQNEVEPVISTVDESWSMTRWTVNRAVDFIETRDTERPFYLHVGFSKPHAPFDPLLHYWQLYEGMTLPEPIYGDWSTDRSKIPPALLFPTLRLSGGDRLNPQIVRQMRRAYYACITQIDYNLGHLFTSLREQNLLDNTLILFTADHGDMLGDHHMTSKGTMLEGSAHVPMLMRGPEHLIPIEQCGTQRDELVTLADVMSTFLAAAGITADQRPANDGIDITAVMQGSARPRQQWIGSYSNYHGIIKEDYKYLFTDIGGNELLFNLRNDPSETNNLIADPSQAERIGQLKFELGRALHAAGHPASPDGKLIAIAPEPTTEEIRRRRLGRWPGFHSRDRTPIDVLH